MILTEQETQVLRKGISGWLSPEGRFFPVDYGKHAKAALDLEMSGAVNPLFDVETGRHAHGERLLELLGYVKLVCRFEYGNVIESHVLFPQQFGCRHDITDSQKKWLEINCERMTPGQESFVMQYLY